MVIKLAADEASYDLLHMKKRETDYLTARLAKTVVVDLPISFNGFEQLLDFICRRCFKGNIRYEASRVGLVECGRRGPL